LPGNESKTGEVCNLLSGSFILSGIDANCISAVASSLRKVLSPWSYKGEAGETEIEAGFLPTHTDIVMIAVKSSCISKNTGHLLINRPEGRSSLWRNRFENLQRDTAT
jgi:hypothetical protein